MKRTGPRPAAIRATLAPLLALCVGSGCSSAEGNPPAVEDDGVAAGRADTDAATPQGSHFQCPSSGFFSAPVPEAFEFLDALVVDLDDNPIPNLRAQACGINICLNADTLADGTVTIDSVAQIDRAAFKYGLGTLYAEFAYLLPNEPVHHLGTQTTAAFPDPSTSVPLQPGTEVTSGGVTLTLAAEMNEIRIDPFDFDTEELRGFRAVRIPIDKAPAAVDPTMGFEVLYALTPVGTELCPRATLTVPNDPAWPAGTAVELFVHGVDVAQKWAPYGGWAKVSDGHVSDDATVITTDAAGGIPILSAIAIRRTE